MVASIHVLAIPIIPDSEAHAGELAGPQSMENVIDTLQLTWIEHGVTAIEYEGLMARLVNQTITLDMRPTSNLKLRVVDDLAAYPIKQFHQGHLGNGQYR